MRTYTFHLEGDPETLPTVEWVTVRDEERAVELARKRLREWRSLRAIEVRHEAQIVSRLERGRAPGADGATPG